MRRAVELDPLRVEYAGWLTRFLLYDKDYEAAIAAGKELLEVDEEYGRGFVWMGSAISRWGSGGCARLVPAWPGARPCGRSYDVMIVRALAPRSSEEARGNHGAASRAESRQQYVRSEYLAMGHAALGDMDVASIRSSAPIRRGRLA